MPQLLCLCAVVAQLCCCPLAGRGGPPLLLMAATPPTTPTATPLTTPSPSQIVVGHHPVRSYGEHCTQGGTQCRQMQWLKPLLRKYNVRGSTLHACCPCLRCSCGAFFACIQAPAVGQGLTCGEAGLQKSVRSCSCWPCCSPQVPLYLCGHEHDQQLIKVGEVVVHVLKLRTCPASCGAAGQGPPTC